MDLEGQNSTPTRLIATPNHGSMVHLVSKILVIVFVFFFNLIWFDLVLSSVRFFDFYASRTLYQPLLLIAKADS
jgi:hypothetical protein